MLAFRDGQCVQHDPAFAQVLKLLRDSTGNILDDEVLINVLNTSKTTSSESCAKSWCHIPITLCLYRR